MDEDTSNWNPVCVASTEDDGRSPMLGTAATSAENGHCHRGPNYFKSAEWLVSTITNIDNLRLTWIIIYRSPDGTTVLTDSADHHIRTFILSVVPSLSMQYSIANRTQTSGSS